MDVLPSPEHLLPGVPVGQRVGDPWLRAQLPAAVLARPQDDTVDRAVWWQVAQALEATGHAVACAQDGTEPSSTALLATFALSDTDAAVALLAGSRAGGRPRLRLLGGARPGSVRLVPVERTWFRLAGLLVGPSPADADVLGAVLADHAAALRQWREVLLAPARTRRAAVSA